jgi:hypothetical protein
LLEPNEPWQAALQSVTSLEIDVDHLDKATAISRLAQRQSSRRAFYFGNWANLKKLSLGGQRELRDLKTLTLGKRLNSLGELKIRLTALDAIRLEEPAAQAVPSMHTLKLNGNWKLNEIPDLSGATSLKHAAIVRNPRLKALSELAKCASLETLKYVGNGNREALPDLSRLTQMTRLELRVPSMVAVTGLEPMEHLKELKLNHIGEQRLALHPNAGLEVLDVGGQMGGLLLPEGGGMDRLRTLVRSHIGTRLPNLQSLARTPQLQTLRLARLNCRRLGPGHLRRYRTCCARAAITRNAMPMTCRNTPL